MTTQSFLLLAVFLVVLLALAWPLGILLARVGDGGAVPGFAWLGKIERAAVPGRRHFAPSNEQALEGLRGRAAGV